MQSYERVKNYFKKFLVQYKKIIKYLISGVVSVGADYGTFMLLYYVVGVSLRISVPTGLITGLIVSFALNKFWAFESSKQKGYYSIHVQVVMYIILVIFNTLFTYYFVKIALVHGMPASISKLLAVAATVCWNYMLYKKLIFKSAPVI